MDNFLKQALARVDHAAKKLDADNLHTLQTFVYEVKELLYYGLDVCDGGNQFEQFRADINYLDQDDEVKNAIDDELERYAEQERSDFEEHNILNHRQLGLTR